MDGTKLMEDAKKQLEEKKKLYDELFGKERTPERRRQMQLLKLAIWNLQGYLADLERVVNEQI